MSKSKLHPPQLENTERTAFVFFILLFIFGAFQTIHAEVYKWTDEKGGVHFTEDPSTIPDRFRDKATAREMQDSGNQTIPPASRSRGNSITSFPRGPIGRSRITERKALTEYEINGFLGRYTTVQHDEYEPGSYTKTLCRRGDRIPRIADECRTILDRCPNFEESQFRNLVEGYATYSATEYAPGSKTTVIHEKGEIIPSRVLSLLRQYCEGIDASEERGPSPSTKKDEGDRERMYSTDYGYHNPQTGGKWHKNYDWIHDSVTGESMHETDYGYYNPKTGEKWHRTSYGLIKSGDN